MKTSKDYLSEANTLVEKISVNDGIKKHNDGAALFIDVRDSADIERTGTISNCLRIPRGMMEFVADEDRLLHGLALTLFVGLRLVPQITFFPLVLRSF